MRPRADRWKVWKVEQLTLANGMTIVIDPQPSLGTTALALYLPVGSRHEAPEEWGYAHFLEHAVFKGAGEWDGATVAERMDRLGGEVNAFTTRDYTAFYAKVLAHKAVEAGELLLTLVRAPHLSAADIALEREVIRQEWNEGQDDLEDVSEQRYMEALWHDTPLAHDVLGTPETVAAADPDRLRRFWRRHYRPQGAVLAVAGSAAAATADALLASAAAWPMGEGPPPTLDLPRPGEPWQRISRMRATQVHLTMGCLAPVWDPAASPDPALDYAVALCFVTIWGGQNSSRLWRRLREQEGLVYSVGTGMDSHPQWADMSLFMAVEPRRLARALRSAGEELARLIDQGVSGEELERARTLIHTNWVFGMETADGRVHRLAPWVLARRPPPTPEALSRRLARVTPEAVQRAAGAWWGQPHALAVGAAGAVPGGVDDLREAFARGLWGRR